MKLLFFSKGNAHRKNVKGINMMCEAYSIDIETTDDIQRVLQFDYNILILNDTFIHPDNFPNEIKIIYGPQFIPCGEMIGTLNPAYSKKTAYNSLSVWNQISLNEVYGELIVPVQQFPFAVDVNRFDISERSIQFDCLVYFKHRKTDVLESVLNIMFEKNISFKLINYGSYEEEDYIRYLSQCKFMISVDAHESQGFALQEAMSCGVPLLVLDATSLYDESTDGLKTNYENRNGYKLVATSVPYWSEKCGLRIKNVDELSKSLDAMIKNYDFYKSREFIVETLSPKVCMKQIIDFFLI